MLAYQPEVVFLVARLHHPPHLFQHSLHLLFQNSNLVKSATPPLGGWGWDSSWPPRPAPPSWRSSRGRAPRPAGSPCQGFLPPWISFHLIPWNSFHSQSWHVVSLAQKCSLWQVSVFPPPSHIWFSLPVVKLTRASPTPENLDFLKKINFVGLAQSWLEILYLVELILLDSRVLCLNQGLHFPGKHQVDLLLHRHPLTLTGNGLLKCFLWKCDFHFLKHHIFVVFAPQKYLGIDNIIWLTLQQNQIWNNGRSCWPFTITKTLFQIIVSYDCSRVVYNSYSSLLSPLGRRLATINGKIGCCHAISTSVINALPHIISRTSSCFCYERNIQASSSSQLRRPRPPSQSLNRRRLMVGQLPHPPRAFPNCRKNHFTVRASLLKIFLYSAECAVFFSGLL